MKRERIGLSSLASTLVLIGIAAAAAVTLYYVITGSTVPVASKHVGLPAIRVVAASATYDPSTRTVTVTVVVQNVGKGLAVVDSIYLIPSISGETVYIDVGGVPIPPGSTVALRGSATVGKPPGCPCRVVVSASGVEASYTILALS